MPETQADNQSRGASSINVPPPPKAEVVVRTMQSDLDRMGQAGGAAPRGKKVAVPDEEQQTGGGFEVQKPQKGTRRVVLWVVLGVVGVAVLFAVGFFVVPALL